MDIKEVIYTRRSIRAYQDKPVEKALIEQCIDAAIQAPTAMNGQPWAFAVIQDQKTLKELSDETKAFLLGMMDKMPAMERYREALESADYSVFYNAPALVIICAKPDCGPAPMIDSALAAENLMLMARSLGIGSCWIGFCGMYLGTDDARKKYGIPDGYSVQAPIILGYPEGGFSTMERSPVEMIYWK